MRHCTTLAVVLSLSACEHASQATQPSTPDPTPPAAARSAPPTPAPAPAPTPAISAQPKAAPATEAKKTLPKMPCRARVCPEWKTEPKLVVEPQAQPIELRPELVEDRRFGISRAGTSWRGEKTKIRIQQKPAEQTEAGK